MRNTITFLFVLFSVFAFGQDIEDYMVSLQQATISFPPAGTVITNGEPNGGTGWETPLNGSTFSTGYATVVGGNSDPGNAEPGRISYDASNWSLRQNSVFSIDGSTSYTVKFEARTTDGSTGDLELGRGYAPYFNQAVTSSWVEYTVTFDARSDTWSDDLSIGGGTPSDTFEIRNISAVAN